MKPAAPRFNCVMIVALLSWIIFIACSANRTPHEQERAPITQPFGRPFKPGDILVVRGVFSDCPDWTGRPVSMAEIPPDGGVELLGAIQVNALGRRPDEVREDLIAAYLAVVPERPAPRLTVEVFDSIHAQRIGRMVAISLAWHLSGKCPDNPPPPPFWWRETISPPIDVPRSKDIRPIAESLE